jgi:Carboxypeptidase C (cathepsin A)
MMIRGKKVAYNATAEETYITNIEGEPVGRFFTFAYVRNGPVDRNRPVLFVFNGGPGSASLWLQMGALGPQRAFLDKDVNPSSVPPFGLLDNGDSPLDVTDLVFIDPIGTGFSHAVGTAEDADFAGVDADADSVARFIEAWLSRNGRYGSPKFVLGESYGGYRAALLPRALMGGLAYGGTMRGITLDGVIIVGSPLSAGASKPAAAESVNRAVASLIPGMAVTAHYHHLLPDTGKSVAEIYDEAAAFARKDYAEAVYRMRQGTLEQAELRTIADRLAQYTAVPADLWISNKLEINQPQYGALALSGSDLVVGLYDSRYTLPARHSGGDFVADDPAMAQYVPGIIAGFHEMLKDQLKVEMPMPYEAIVWEGVFSRWDSRRLTARPTQTYADDLAIAMRRQPRMQVMMMSGYYDLLATPMAMADAAEQAGLPTDRLVSRVFESGHMSYLGGTAPAFAEDIRQFIVNMVQGRTAPVADGE